MKTRKGKEGVSLQWGLPGGKKWQAWGIQRETVREACEEIGVPRESLEVVKYLGNWRHPQFPGRVTHYTLIRLCGRAVFTPGRNVKRVELVTPEEMVRRTKTMIYPLVLHLFGLTEEMVAAIRSGETG